MEKKDAKEKEKKELQQHRLGGDSTTGQMPTPGGDSTTGGGDGQLPPEAANDENCGAVGGAAKKPALIFRT